MVEQASANAALAVAIAVLIGVAISFQSLLVIAGCCVAAAEAVFAVCFLVKLKRLDALPTTPGPGHDAKALMRKCIARITYSDDYLSSWFDGVPRDQIHKQNLREFMAYGFWFKQYDDLSDHDKLFMEQVLRQLEKQTGVVLPEGRNPNIHFLSHLWDPLKVSYKPLVFYICTEALAWATACLLHIAGFDRHCHKGQVFYTYRLGTGTATANGQSSIELVSDNMNGSSKCSNKGQDPLLFIHGVGAGLLPYLLFVYKLMSTGRPLILPDLKHISMRYTSRVPNVEDCAVSLSEFLESVGVRRVHVMGHSYGTLVCARLAINFRNKVSSLALLDPVCFAMYMPRLIRTFLYAKSPNSGNWLLDQALLLVAKELHCATTFCRQFIWNDYNLWPERLPARTLVVLSGGDVLCPAEDVKQHLEEETAARVMFHPTLHHGAVMLWPGYADMVIKGWQQMLLDPAPAAPAAEAAVAAASLEAEPVQLHGTATTAEDGENQDEPPQQPAEDEDEASDDATVVLLDQDAAPVQQPQQQQRQNKGLQQLQWHQQLQHQWQQLQQSDLQTAASLLQPNSNTTASTVAAEGISVGCDVSTKASLSHQRHISECPSYGSGDLVFLGGLQEFSTNSVNSDSPVPTSWSVNTDDNTSSSSGRSSIQCEQCGSPFVQQQRSFVASPSSCSDESWVGVDEQEGSPRLQQQQQQQQPLQQPQAARNTSVATSSSCSKEQLAVLCECCCQQRQQWQQVVEATCA